MPHSPEARRRAINRLRKIRGQAEALERGIEAGACCGDVLQQLAAIRGGVNALMREVLEGHLRETFGHADCDPTDPDHARAHAAIAEVTDLIRSYLK